MVASSRWRPYPPRTNVPVTIDVRHRVRFPREATRPAKVVDVDHTRGHSRLCPAGDDPAGRGNRQYQ
jgi:hypothetical protein